MADAIKLDPKKTAFIIIDMVNAIAKGGPGPDYTLPDNRKDIVASFQKMITHCRKVGTPLIYITTHRRADNADGPKTVSDIGEAAETQCCLVVLLWMLSTSWQWNQRISC